MNRNDGHNKEPSSEEERERLELSPEFLHALRWWENAAHNRPGSDKSWIERLVENSRRHHRSARRIR